MAHENAHTDDRWFAYECTMCPVVGQGIVLDVRAPRESVKEVKCPLCKRPMHFCCQWEAGEGGYGSRGNSGALNLVRAAEAFERAACAVQCRVVAERYEGQPSVASTLAALECAQAIEGRNT